MEVIIGRIFDYLVNQITGGILPRFLYVVCVVVVVRDGLSLLVLDKGLKLLFCFAHVGR